jgi:hypothetical protein
MCQNAGAVSSAERLTPIIMSFFYFYQPGFGILVPHGKRRMLGNLGKLETRLLVF